MRTRLETLHKAVTGGDPAPAAAMLRPHPRLSAREQIAIYSNGYRVRLAAAVEADYPALAHYLGAERMKALVQAYVEATPSRGWNLDRYPHGFADFLQATDAPEEGRALALLERSIALVFMEEESEPLTRAHLDGLDEERLERWVFRPRTASCLLLLSFDAEAYLQGWKDGAAGEGAAIARQDTPLMLVRHDHEVQRHRLESAEYRLLARLCAGEAFGMALSACPEDEAAFAAGIALWLPRWIAGGFFRC